MAARQALVLGRRCRPVEFASIDYAYRRLAPDATPLDGAMSRTSGLLTLSAEQGCAVHLATLGAESQAALEGVRFSAAALSGIDVDAEHDGHHLLVMTSPADLPATCVMSIFSPIIAAVAVAADANAVHVGDARATHPAEFFIEMTRTVAHPVMLWAGVRVAETRDRIELLSQGMRPFSRPELWLTVDRERTDDALVTFFELLETIAVDDGPIAHGHRIGPAQHRVQHARSPLDDGHVLRVDVG